MKSLTVNCDSVVLLKDREDILTQYDNAVFNCATVTVSDALYAKLMSANVVFNNAKTNVIAPPQNPVRLTGLTTLGANAGYEGAFLVADDMLVLPEGAEKLDALEGALILGKIYHPDNAAVPGKIRANKFIPYPANAIPEMGDVWLRANEGRKWLPDTEYFVSGTAYALDAAHLKELKAQGNVFHCGTVYLYESMQAEYGAMFGGAKTICIPDGYAFVKDSAPLMDLYATHGKKIWLNADLTVQPREVKYLNMFESVLVQKTARLPLDHLEACQRVISAAKVSVYEGELMNINGFQIVSKAMLEEANRAGTKYTVNVNGAMLIEDDVTPQDIEAIVSMRINGAVSAPTVTHAYLNKLGRINGVLLPALSELKKMVEQSPDGLISGLGGMIPGPIAKMLGVKGMDDGASTVLNCAHYTLI